ncbi:YtxH domain-containing protein [Patescibacteria group bacterium]|nr:YtxH domain-containing protein [Patescibacteria group bacterium]
MGKFKKGLCLGGLLGAGLTWLNVTKKGRETRSQLLDHSADVYEKVKVKIEESGAMEKMSKNKYVKTVQEVVDKYAVDNGMADKVKNVVTKLVSAQYKNVKKK